MWQDPIVAEVRRVRLEIEKECDEDFARIYARAIEVQKEAAARLALHSSCHLRASEVQSEPQSEV